jgi:CheY-like chemotaxis protein
MAGRILVLDDEENYAEMLQDLLREHDYRVDIATRPERAIDQLEEIPYDLVISDYKMPVMDGADFLKKSRELYPNLPFILVSGLMNTPELVKVANLNVTLVMEKPLDTAVFLEHVAKFAEPMTDEQKKAFEGQVDSKDTDTSKSVSSYPEEPHFFSACCAISKRFMRDVWDVCRAGTHLFILEPTGGDGLLAVKDLSIWRGNTDKQINEIDFDDFSTGGAGKIKEVLSDEEMSDVISIRLSSTDQIPMAQRHLQQVLKVVESAKEHFFIYLVEGTMSAAEFAQITESAGCVLPALSKRPSDVARYGCRFSRMHAVRSAKPKAVDFSPEAVYAILNFEWPGNYQQIHDTIAAVVAQGGDEPITLQALEKEIGQVSIPAPELRLAEFLKKTQLNQLENELETSAGSMSMLVHRLQLDSKLKSKDDLKQMPLINPNLATL